MCKGINSTAITLVPKVNNPPRVTDFRQISCYITLYKVISKRLTSRMQKIMPCLISDNQVAFVKGRSIVSNILMGALIGKALWKERDFS